MTNRFRDLLDKLPEERRKRIKKLAMRLIDKVLRKNQNLNNLIKHQHYQGKDS